MSSTPRPPDPYAEVRRLLTDTAVCPACAHRLDSSRCAACGLEVTGPQGRALWDLSMVAKAALDRRAEHVTDMRTGQARREAARQAAETAAEAARQTAARAAESREAVARESAARHAWERDAQARAAAAYELAARSAAPPPRAPEGPGPSAAPDPWAHALAVGSPQGARPTPRTPRPRPRWRVQTVLQVTGSILLAAASIVFLLFSWGWIGLVGRAVAVAIGTVVVFALAGRLRRARLGSSAEAVGGLAAVLLLLDAWAVQATGLIHPSQPGLYAATACLVCAVLLIVWGRVARLRVGTLTGSALVPLAPVLLAPLVPGLSGLAWCLVAAVGLATGRFWLPSGRDVARGKDDALPVDGERVVLAVAGWIATLVAGAASAWVVTVVAVVTAQLTSRSDGLRPAWSATGALATLGVLAAVQTVRARAGMAPQDSPPTPGSTFPGAGTNAVSAWWGPLPGVSRWSRLDLPAWWATCAGTAAAGTSLAVGAGVVAELGAPPAALMWVPATIAGLVAAGLRLLGARTRRRAEEGPATTPTDLDRIGDAAVLIVLATGIPSALLLPITTLLTTFEPDTAPSTFVASVTAASAVTALLLVVTGRTAWTARVARTVAVWLGAAVLLAVPSLLAVTAPVLAGAGAVAMLLALGLGAHLADLAAARRPLGGRAPRRVVTAVAPLLALASTQGDPVLTAASMAGVALLALAVRGWLHGRTGPRAGTVAAAGVAAWSAALYAAAAAEVPEPLGLLGVGTLGLGLVAAAGVSHRLPWGVRDRQAALLAAVPLAALGWGAGIDVLTRATSVRATGSLTVLAALVATASALMVVGATSAPVGRVSRFAAAAALVPCAVATLVSVHAAAGGRAGLALTVGIAVAGSVALMLAPLLAATSPQGRTTPDEPIRRTIEVGGWCAVGAALLLAGAAGSGQTAIVLVVASTTAGAWALQRDRRWGRWCAITLAVIASWVLLVADDIGTTEAYLAPAGVVLAGIGLHRWRRGAADEVPLLAAGLGLVALPTAVQDGALAEGTPSRVGLALALAVLLVGTGIWATRRARVTDRATPDVDAEDRPRVRPEHVLLGVGLLVAVSGPARHALTAALTGSSSPTTTVARLLEVEAWSWPVALVVAAAAYGLSSRWPSSTGSPRHWGPWLTAAAIALPTLVAVRDTPLGTVRWTTMFALGAVLAGLSARAVRVPTRGPSPSSLLVLGLTVAAGAALAGSLTSTVLPADLPVALLGLLVTATATLQLRRASASAKVSWQILGPLLLVPTVLDTSESWRAPLATALAAGLVLVGAWLRTPLAGPDESARERGSTHAHRLLVATGAILALLGPAVHAVVGASGFDRSPELLDVELWSVLAAAIIVGAGQVMSVRWTAAAPHPSRWIPWLAAGVLAVPTLVAVGPSPLGTARWTTTFTLGAILAVLAARTVATPLRGPSPRALVVLGLTVAAGATLAGSLTSTVVPADLPVAILGLLVMATGTLRLRRTRTTISWQVLGPLLLVPTVLDTSGWWRAPLATALAAGLVVVGAWLRVPLAEVDLRDDQRPAASAASAASDGPEVSDRPDRSGRIAGSARAQLFLVGSGGMLALLGPAVHAIAGAAGSTRPPLLVDVELWSVLAAVILLGADRVLSQRRSPAAPDRSGWVPWLIAGVLAVPTLVAVDPGAVGLARWSVVLVSAGASAIIGARASTRAGTRLLAIGLVAGALAASVAASSGGPLPPELPLALLGLLVVAVAVLRQRRTDRFVAWSLLGPVLLVPAVLLDAEAWRTPATLACAVLLVGVALRPRPATRGASDAGTLGDGSTAEPQAGDGWTRAQVFLAAAGAALAVVGPLRRSVVSALASGPTPGTGDVEVWSLPSAAVVAAAALVLIRAWTGAGRAVDRGPVLWALPVTLTAAAVPSLLAVDGSLVGLVRVGALVVAGSVLAVRGALTTEDAPRADDPGSARAGAEGRRRRVCGIVLVVAAAIAATTRGVVHPADVPIVVVGVVLLTVGVLRSRASTRSSWRTLAPGLVVTLGTPLVTGWLEPTTWRLLLVLVAAVVAVVLGAIRRSQAPFVLGAGALVMLAVLQLSAAAVAAMRGLEWWVVLAVGGAVLLGLGLTYERRLREATEAVRFVGGMR